MTELVIEKSWASQDSSGLSALVAGNHAITGNGHVLRTFGEQDNVLRVLEIAGLDNVFHGKPPGP